MRGTLTIQTITESFGELAGRFTPDESSPTVLTSIFIVCVILFKVDAYSTHAL